MEHLLHKMKRLYKLKHREIDNRYLHVEMLGSGLA
jgi:hypothetical protein